MQILESFRNVLKIEELRNRLYMTLFLLVVFRVGCHICLPGVNPEAVQSWNAALEKEGGSAFHMLQLMSGGSAGNMALFSLGIMPYITASIIMQLLTKVSPTLEAVAKEGPSGQRKINQYTRYLSVPVCIIQAVVGMKGVMSMQTGSQGSFLISDTVGAQILVAVGLVAGTMFVMWLGEQITEHGIGNGASLLIMSGIVARMPSVIWEMIGDARDQTTSADKVLVTIALYVLAIAGVVFVTQAQRRIPVQSGKHFRGRRVLMGARNFLPLRVNTAGVMPVIFASSLLVVPSLAARIPGLSWMMDFAIMGTFLHAVFYITLIFFFSYFWTYLFFQPVEMANNLKEYGSFVPGIRPGDNTATYLNAIISRITVCGAAFLCALALLPDLTVSWMETDRYVARFLGGTGLLIVVGVALDMVQKIESHLLMHHYEGFVGSGGIRGRR